MYSMLDIAGMLHYMLAMFGIMNYFGMLDLLISMKVMNDLLWIFDITDYIVHIAVAVD